MCSPQTPFTLIWEGLADRKAKCGAPWVVRVFEKIFSQLYPKEQSRTAAGQSDALAELLALPRPWVKTVMLGILT